MGLRLHLLFEQGVQGAGWIRTHTVTSDIRCCSTSFPTDTQLFISASYAMDYTSSVPFRKLMSDPVFIHDTPSLLPGFTNGPHLYWHTMGSNPRVREGGRSESEKNRASNRLWQLTEAKPLFHLSRPNQTETEEAGALSTNEDGYFGRKSPSNRLVLQRLASTRLSPGLNILPTPYV
jgi:hypothetical protein